MSHPQPDDLLPLALRLAFTPSRMLSTTVVVRLRLNADPLVLSPANVRHCTLSSRPVCSFVVRWRSRRSTVRSRNTYASDLYGLLFCRAVAFETWCGLLKEYLSLWFAQGGTTDVTTGSQVRHLSLFYIQVVREIRPKLSSLYRC